MRTIKFRGYNAKNKEWLHGCYLINRGEHFICPDGEQPLDKTWEDFQIDPETLGQFTGLHDKNGKEIYEGDIIKFLFHGLFYRGTIIYKDAKFVMKKIYGDGYMFPQDYGEKHIEIIGNIHDDKSLII